MVFNGRATLPCLASLAILVLSAWRLAGSSTDAEKGLRTDGPMQLSLAAGTAGASPFTQVQLEARKAMFSLSPKLNGTAVGPDRLWQMTNAGQKTIRCYAYGSSFPIYRMEIRKRGGWAPMPMGWSSSGGVIMLKHGQSLCFPAMTSTTGACRIGIRYEEVAIPETVMENVACLLKGFFLPEKNKGEWFLAYSDVLKG